MSQENVEMLRRGYEAYNRGDAAGTVADFAPTFEYHDTPEFPMAVCTWAVRVFAAM